MSETKAKRQFLSEKTYIPISLVILVICAAISFGALHTMVLANQNAVAKNENSIRHLRKDTSEMDRRIYEKVTDVSENLNLIHGKVDVIIIQLDKNEK